MAFDRPIRLAVCLAMAASLPVAHAAPAGAPPAPPAPRPLRIQLQVVDSCRVEPGTTPPACATAHQRSDAPTPPPPQVQALSPVPEDGPGSRRAWQTFTF